MPKRHTIPGLEKLCMLNIVQNIDGWTRNYEDNYMGKGTYRYILGPFDVLGGYMVEELTNLLIEEKRVTKAALHLLLNGGKFRHLDLSRCPKLVTDDVVHLISSKCKKLKTLNLSDCKRISKSALCILAQCLQHAVRLDLSKTSVDRQVMQYLVNNSEELIELSLRRCGVDDQDLQVLCWVASQRNSATKLLKLDVSQTYVTAQGMSDVLKQMPQLQIIRYPGIFYCLFETYLPDDFEDGVDQETLELSVAKVLSKEKTEQYQLRSLVCEDFAHIPNVMLYLLPLLCPRITHLDIRFTTGFDDTGLRQLAGLMELKQLELCCQQDGSSSITFHGGIMPLLSERGSKIEKLSLQDIDNTDLITICTLCPNLRGLHIFMMHDGVNFSSSTPSQAGLCHCLQVLSIWGRHGDLTLTPANLTLVLSLSTELQELNLIRTDTLTDYVLQEVIQKNPFVKLQKLSLHECNAVSGEIMTEFLLNETNSLQNVKLMSCRNIARRDFIIWKNIAEKEQFDIAIDWK